MFGLLKDLWKFMKVRKKYWLAPIVIVLLLIAVLVVFVEGSVIAPFIYSVF
jgi:competence protein ComGC